MIPSNASESRRAFALAVRSRSENVIRGRIIERLPGRARRLFPWGNENGVFVKPVPGDELPAYAFMVHLLCYEPVSGGDSDMSSLIVCWLGDDSETSLPELIGREICDVDWDKHAVDGSV